MGMRFEDFEEAGTVEVEYVGDSLDAYSLGIINIHIQDITDKVSLWRLSQEGLIEPTWRRPRNRPNRMILPSQTLVKARIHRIASGSLVESVGFAVAMAVADDNVRAVLHGLASNLLFAISVSRVKGIISQWRRPLVNVPPLRRPDPFEVGPNLREIIATLAENSEGKDTKLTFKSRSNNHEDIVEIQITNSR